MPESQHTEWKASWHDDYLKWICGFANAEGGTLVLGKDDEGKIIGLENAEIDSWGRGVEKISEACKASGLDAPVFTERSGGVLVELLRPSEMVDVFRNDFGMISEKVRKEFGSNVAKAFNFICQHPDSSAEEIAAELGKTARTIENYIAKLKEGGVIVRKGPKLGGHWEIVEE